jgi:ATP-binding cassette subfamily F protein 3
MLAQWHNIFLSFPDKQVLRGASLAVHHGDRIALVGENGSGKTCLFRILLGRLSPDSGEVSVASGVRIGYLDQSLADLEVASGVTCFEVALGPFERLRAEERRIEELHAALARSPQETDLLDELGAAQERFEAAGGYGYRVTVEQALHGLGLPPAIWDRPVALLSSGRKVRLALARLLLPEHDLLLLDEPTNHLDLPAREWLERHLAGLQTACVVASHDRVFLDTVATKVAHLEGGRITVYSGNYSGFRRQYDLRIETAQRVHEKRERLVRSLQQQVHDYRNWARSREADKRARASGGRKQPGKVDKGYIGARAAKLMKRAIITQRRLERTIQQMKTERPMAVEPVAMTFRAAEGHRLLYVRDLDAGYTEPLVRGFTFELRVGDRLAVVGANGSGKTALLRTLIGDLPPLAGEVRLAPSIRIGYFDQENRCLPMEGTALEAVLRTGKDQTLVRTVMGRMRIRRESVNKPVGDLSAGERTKVLLACLILGDCNLLVLDEPTNHLDIETQDALLAALLDFPGGIVFTSHDRHFIGILGRTTLDLGARPGVDDSGKE